MRALTHSLAIFMVVFLFSSCNKNRVNLIETNAKDEVPTLGNLRFIFDKNLMPDSLFNVWDTARYVEFNPPIRGRFRWENAGEVIFSPEMDLPPATKFTATITSHITKYAKTYSLGKCGPIEFHTPDLRLSAVMGIWNIGDGNTGNAFPQIDINFNYKVNPEKVNELLSVKLGGEKIQFNVQSTTPDTKVSVVLVGLKPEDKDLTLQLEIAPGLTPERGKTPTAKTLNADVFIVSPFKVQIMAIENDHDGTMGSVRISTSQPLADEHPEQFVSIEPQVRVISQIVPEGLLITSEDFDVTKTYQLTISEGLKGKLGGTLRSDYTSSIAFGKLEPEIKIANTEGVYLSAGGERNIEVTITSVNKVKITISKIYENNLMAMQRYGYRPDISHYDYDDEYYEDGDGYSSYYSSEAVLGDIIYQKEIDTKSLPRANNNRLFKFDFRDKISDLKGIYHLRIQSADDYWVNSSCIVSLSDIGLIAKETDDKVYVFANSIKTAESLNGVNVSVIGSNNQLIGSGTTDNNGVATVKLRKKEFNGFSGAMITARSGSDFNYLPFRTTHVETSRFDIGGKRKNVTDIDAFIYSERDIYRPGEKMNFSVIARNWIWKSPGEIPLKMKLLLPNGRELKTLRKTLNDQGSLETQIELSPSAVTGSYTFEVFSYNDILIATKSVLVEEFMPDRIKVRSTLDKKFLKPGDTSTLSVSAVNFFGPPAANRNYEIEVQVKERYFYPDNYPAYSFTISGRNAYYPNVNREGTLDSDGKATFEYSVPKEYVNRGILQADFFTTVFDETGRPVNRKSSVDIYTQDVFYGIGFDGYYYCPLNKPVNFPLVALTQDEKPVNTKAHVQVIKHDYRTVLSRSYSYFRYESQRDDKTIIDKEIQVSENTVFSFTPQTPGEYEIRVGKPGTNTFVTREFYSYGYYVSSRGGNFKVNNKGNIDIESDKAAYKAGETAKLLFKTPFNGKLLVTLETDRVIDYKYVQVENRMASLDYQVTTDYLPNVYITATLIKPHEETDMPLTVAHGFKSLSVGEDARKIPVQIVAEKKVRSRTHQKVTVKAVPNAKITLAVVDEGILQITNYKTPDPYEHFYAKRALGVNSFDLYPLLFSEVKASSMSTGGDGFDLSKRTNPLQNKRVKLVSYWSGITQSNSNGEAQFEFDIPQFSGQLRLMAVCYKNESFGSEDLNMTVADPIVISTALPRFLSPGDTVFMPVTITNTTSNSTTATASVKVSGPVKVVETGASSVQLKPNAEERITYKLVADPQVAAANIKVEVNALKEKFVEETDITVRPPASLQKITGAGSIQAGSNKQIILGSDKFIASSISSQLITSNNPALELADQMYYLVNYPHGCTEQTVSAAFPQLYFGDLAELLKMGNNQKVNANTNVLEAIRKIKMRQLYSGAITLWDNEGSENWWASVYAAHFLIEAKAAGFEVDKSLMDNLLQYLSSRLKTRETMSYYYNGSQNKRIAPKEVAYSLYVLALAGKPQISTMNYYRQNEDVLALDSRYLLGAAFALAGDKGKFSQMLPASFSGEIAVKETGGSFSSDLRDESVSLNAILEVDPDNPQVGVMAKHIAQQLKDRYYLSTQERAFSFLALGKIARKNAGTKMSVTVKVDGKLVSQNDGSLLRLTSKQLSGKNVEVSVSGSGTLYYFWQSEGISKDGSFKQEDSYLRVRKKFFDRYGRPVTSNNFKQNDLVIVALYIDGVYNRYIDNVVITDMLPAGFEIENPRTQEIPGMNWIKDQSYPTYTDVRDDRINLYVGVGSRTQTYYYAVRAVSPGVYVMGPVMADAMYNGEYHSYNGAGIIRIE